MTQESSLLVAIGEAMTIYLIASGLRPGGAYDPEGACSYRKLADFDGYCDPPSNV